MGENEIFVFASNVNGYHEGGPHVNFETLKPNPNKPGKMMVDQNYHVFITEYISVPLKSGPVKY